MNAKELQREIGRLAAEVQKLAALGASLRLRQSESVVDARVRRLLEQYVDMAFPDTVDRLDGEQAALAIGYIDLLVGEAAELLRNPGRPAGANPDDVFLLQAQGRLSRYGFRAIEALIGQFPDLAAALRGVFLEVGTGVGGLAIEAVSRCPALRVVAIDISEPALALARTNAQPSGHADRIDFKQVDVRQLQERTVYDVAWLPAPYLGRSVLELALDKLLSALKPQGFLILGYQTLPNDALPAAFAELRIARSGGIPWSAAELTDIVTAHGFIEAQIVTPFPEANYIVARKPAG